MTTSPSARYRKGAFFLVAAALAALAGFARPGIAPAHAAPAHAAAASIRLPGHIPALVRRSALIGAMDGAQTIRLSLVLPLRNQSGLSDLIRRMYDPQDPEYGQSLTPQQFADQFGPTPADYQAATAFAQANGLTVTHTYSSRTLLEVSGSVTAVEQAFGVNLLQYRSPDTGRTYYAPDADPAIPAQLSGVITGIVGLDNALVMTPQYQSPPPAALGLLGPLFGTGLGGGLSPSDIAKAYNLPGGTVNGTGQALGVYELDGYNPSDIAVYDTQYGLPGVTLQNEYVDGNTGEIQSEGGPVEVTLDIELQEAVAPHAAKFYVYEADNGTSGVVDEFTRIATDDLAQTISVSWGGPEYTGESSTDPDEAAIDQACQEMATQHQSIFIASGDTGAYLNGSSLTVSSFAADPYVIGVGGTTLSLTGTGDYASETTWNELAQFNYGGGGGISMVWPIPSYQRPAVAGNAQSSKTMRNVPDVSLDADPGTGYSIYVTDFPAFNGWGEEGGTSCAAPVWAAFTALVNQVRAQNGQSTPIGFLNPLIYPLCEGQSPYTAAQYGNDFHDINDGSNNGYYDAVTGYDDATGWGSFNGANLLGDLAGVSVNSVSQITSLTINASAAAPGNILTGVVKIKAAAPTGGSVVTLASTDPAALSVPATVTIPAGATSVTFSVTAASTPVTVPIAVTILASNTLFGQSAAVTVLPYAITALTLSSPSGISGTTKTATLTLSNSTSIPTTVPLAGIVLVNGRAQPAINLPVALPAQVVVPAGVSQVTFPIGVNNTAATTLVQITTQELSPDTDLPYQLLTGPDSQTVDFTVLPASLTAVTLTNPVTGGGAGTGTVTLNGTAPSGGAVVALSTLYASQITIPASVTIPAGAMSAQFSFSAFAIGNPATVAITASYLGVSQTGQTTITPTGTPGLTFSPSTIGPGVDSIGTITVSQAAAPGGLPVGLSSSNSAAVNLPPSVIIPGGQTSATFTVTGNSVAQTTTVDITPSINGVSQSPVPLTVTPPTVAAVSVSPASVTGSVSAKGTVTLSAVAPTDSQGGLVVDLQSGDTAAATVPTSVLVPTGSTTATFSIGTSPVAASTPVTLSAVIGSTAAQTATLTVQPPTVSALVVAPAAVFGGNSATGTLTLVDPAPAAGTIVNLQSSNTGAATVPATVTVAAGATTATFPITTYAVSSPVTISASTDPSFPTSPVGATQTAPLAVSTVGFTLSVSPSTVSLGGSATGTVTLSGAAPTGGLTMYLNAYNPIGGGQDPVTLPATVTVPAGAKTATFPLTTQAVSTSVSITVSASASASFPSGGTQTTSFTVAASGVSLTLGAASVAAGIPVTGTVTLSGPAPTGGETIALASSDSAAASVPASVPVAAGATTATFSVVTHAAGSGISITASLAGQSASVALTVTANAGQSYGTGWNLISLPYDYAGQTPAQIFGFSGASLFIWSAAQLQYLQTPTAPADTVHPGYGYWVYFPQAAQVTTVGVPTDTSQPFSLPLQVGWNMIGDPFNSSVSVSSLTATVNTSVYKYANAGSLLLALYGYTPGANGTVGSYTLMGSSGTLVPGQGYWLYATQSLTLTYPAPASTPAPPAAPGVR